MSLSIPFSHLHPLQTLTQPLLPFRVNLLYLQTLLHTLKLYTLTLALALMHSVEPVIPSTFTHVTRYHDISLYNLPLKPPPHPNPHTFYHDVYLTFGFIPFI